MKKLLFASALLLGIAALPAVAQELAAVAAQPAIIADARTSPDGCAVRVLPDGGFMIFATGSGTYDFDDGDDIAKGRQAAQLNAKANLAKFMKESIATESAMEESSKMVKNLSSKDGEQTSSVDKEMARKTLQTIKSSADALLQAVVTLSEAKVPGNGTGGEIRVVCGVSSKTIEALNHLNTATGQAAPATPADAAPAASTQAAAPAPAAPTVRSSMPSFDLLTIPDGVAVRLPPEGGFMVLAAATAAYDFGDADDILQAKKNAAALAKAGLAKFMKEQLATESALDESAEMVKSMSSENGQQTSSVEKTQARKTLESIRTSADALLQGVVTLSDAKIPGQGTSGEVRVLIGVSSKTLEALDHLKPPVPAPGPGAAPPSAPPPGAPAPEDWIECVGTGKTRYAAIKAALVEGVSMVYGESVSQDTRFKTRLEMFQKDDSTSVEREKESEAETITATAGFVRQYRVVAVKDVSGGLLEATLRALFVDLRAGGSPAVLVTPTTLSLADKTKAFQIGPKARLSGGELAARLDGALASATASANRFLVLTPQSLGTSVAAEKIAEAMVGDGLAPGSELLRASQAATADYVLGSTLEDVQWTSKLGMDKDTKRFAPQRRLSLRLKLHLVDSRKAVTIANEEFSAVLVEPEIAALLAEDENADLLRAALVKVAEAVEKWIAPGE